MAHKVLCTCPPNFYGNPYENCTRYVFTRIVPTSTSEPTPTSFPTTMVTTTTNKPLKKKTTKHFEFGPTTYLTPNITTVSSPTESTIEHTSTDVTTPVTFSRDRPISSTLPPSEGTTVTESTLLDSRFGDTASTVREIVETSKMFGFGSGGAISTLSGTETIGPDGITYPSTIAILPEVHSTMVEFASTLIDKIETTTPQFNESDGVSNFTMPYSDTRTTEFDTDSNTQSPTTLSLPTQQVIAETQTKHIESETTEMGTTMKIGVQKNESIASTVITTPFPTTLPDKATSSTTKESIISTFPYSSASHTTETTDFSSTERDADLSTELPLSDITTITSATPEEPTTLSSKTTSTPSPREFGEESTMSGPTTNRSVEFGTTLIFSTDTENIPTTMKSEGATSTYHTTTGSQTTFTEPQTVRTTPVETTESEGNQTFSTMEPTTVRAAVSDTQTPTVGGFKAATTAEFSTTTIAGLDTTTGGDLDSTIKQAFGPTTMVNFDSTAQNEIDRGGQTESGTTFKQGFAPTQAAFATTVKKPVDSTGKDFETTTAFPTTTKGEYETTIQTTFGTTMTKTLESSTEEIFKTTKLDPTIMSEIDATTQTVVGTTAKKAFDSAFGTTTEAESDTTTKGEFDRTTQGEFDRTTQGEFDRTTQDESDRTTNTVIGTTLNELFDATTKKDFEATTVDDFATTQAQFRMTSQKALDSTTGEEFHSRTKAEFDSTTTGAFDRTVQPEFRTTQRDSDTTTEFDTTTMSEFGPTSKSGLRTTPKKALDSTPAPEFDSTTNAEFDTTTKGGIDRTTQAQFIPTVITPFGITTSEDSETATELNTSTKSESDTTTNGDLNKNTRTPYTTTVKRPSDSTTMEDFETSSESDTTTQTDFSATTATTVQKAVDLSVTPVFDSTTKTEFGTNKNDFGTTSEFDSTTVGAFSTADFELTTKAEFDTTTKRYSETTNQFDTSTKSEIDLAIPEGFRTTVMKSIDSTTRIDVESTTMTAFSISKDAFGTTLEADTSTTVEKTLVSTSPKEIDVTTELKPFTTRSIPTVDLGISAAVTTATYSPSGTAQPSDESTLPSSTPRLPTVQPTSLNVETTTGPTTISTTSSEQTVEEMTVSSTAGSFSSEAPINEPSQSTLFSTPTRDKVQTDTPDSKTTMIETQTTSQQTPSSFRGQSDVTTSKSSDESPSSSTIPSDNAVLETELTGIPNGTTLEYTTQPSEIKTTGGVTTSIQIDDSSMQTQTQKESSSITTVSPGPPTGTNKVTLFSDANATKSTIDASTEAVSNLQTTVLEDITTKSAGSVVGEDSTASLPSATSQESITTPTIERTTVGLMGSTISRTSFSSSDTSTESSTATSIIEATTSGQISEFERDTPAASTVASSMPVSEAKTTEPYTLSREPTTPIILTLKPVDSTETGSTTEMLFSPDSTTSSVLASTATEGHTVPPLTILETKTTLTPPSTETVSTFKSTIPSSTIVPQETGMTETFEISTEFSIDKSYHASTTTTYPRTDETVIPSTSYSDTDNTSVVTMNEKSSTIATEETSSFTIQVALEPTVTTQTTFGTTNFLAEGATYRPQSSSGSVTEEPTQSTSGERSTFSETSEKVTSIGYPTTVSTSLKDSSTISHDLSTQFKMGTTEGVQVSTETIMTESSIYKTSEPSTFSPPQTTTFASTLQSSSTSPTETTTTSQLTTTDHLQSTKQVTDSVVTSGETKSVASSSPTKSPASITEGILLSTTKDTTFVNSETPTVGKSFSSPPSTTEFTITSTVASSVEVTQTPIASSDIVPGTTDILKEIAPTDTTPKYTTSSTIIPELNYTTTEVDELSTLGVSTGGPSMTTTSIFNEISTDKFSVQPQTGITPNIEFSTLKTETTTLEDTEQSFPTTIAGTTKLYSTTVGPTASWSYTSVASTQVPTTGAPFDSNTTVTVGGQETEPGIENITQSSAFPASTDATTFTIKSNGTVTERPKYSTTESANFPSGGPTTLIPNTGRQSMTLKPGSPATETVETETPEGSIAPPTPFSLIKHQEDRFGATVQPITSIASATTMHSYLIRGSTPPSTVNIEESSSTLSPTSQFTTPTVDENQSTTQTHEGTTLYNVGKSSVPQQTVSESSTTSGAIDVNETTTNFPKPKFRTPSPGLSSAEGTTYSEPESTTPESDNSSPVDESTISTTPELASQEFTTTKLYQEMTTTVTLDISEQNSETRSTATGKTIMSTMPDMASTTLIFDTELPQHGTTSTVVDDNVSATTTPFSRVS
ncbi:unnamed protein product, partial [Nesidiocoris tenuis]